LGKWLKFGISMLLLTILISITVSLIHSYSYSGSSPKSTEIAYHNSTSPLPDLTTLPWKKIEPKFNLGYVFDDIWLKVTIKNQKPTTIQRIVEYNNGHTNKVDWYTKSGKLLKSQGLNYIADSPKETVQKPYLKLLIEPNSTKLLYINLASKSVINGEVRVFGSNEFSLYRNFRSNGYAAFIGGLFILCAYQLVLFFSLKDKAYLFYVLLLVSGHGLTLLSLTGFATQKIGPFLPFLKSQLGAIGHGLLALFLPLFSFSFFSGSVKEFRYQYYISVGLGLFSTIFSLLPLSRVTYPILTATLIINVVIILYIATKQIQRSDHNAYFFLFGWLPILVGLLAQYLSTFSIASFLIESETFIFVSASIEGLTLALALAYRYRHIINAKTALENHNREQEINAQQAQLMQESLLIEQTIPELEAASFYQSANNIGGDWFGCFYDEAHQRVYILMGDVTGHGMSSALLSATVAGAARSAVYILSNTSKKTIDYSLNMIAKQINQVVYRTTTQRGLLMTMVFIGIDQKTLSGLIISAGHPHVYQIKKDKVSPILAKGPILGQVRAPYYRSTPFKIASGDLLFIYTDGLFEASTDKKPLNNRLLKKIITGARDPQPLIEKVLARFQESNTTDNLVDDISMLAVAIKRVS